MNSLIGLEMSQVEYDKSRLAVTKVTGDQGTETLLTGSVPELETDGWTGDVKVLRYEIYAHGGVVGGVELVFDESSDYWAFAHGLIANKHELKLQHILFTRRETNLLILSLSSLSTHSSSDVIIFKRLLYHYLNRNHIQKIIAILS